MLPLSPSRTHRALLPAGLVTVTTLTAFAQSGGADSPADSVQINWVEELQKGGITGLALIILAVAAVGFALERLLNLRANLIVPKALPDELRPLGEKGDFAAVRAACAKTPSILSKVVSYVVDHRGNGPEIYMAGAADVAAREVDKHRRKLAPLGIIATLAPLLGLLGTMIGMIESFAKFALIEDSSEASIVLADSIGKALITTAMGLVIAIPTLVVYHSYRSRLNRFSEELEESVEGLTSDWFLRTDADDDGQSAPAESDVA